MLIIISNNLSVKSVESLVPFIIFCKLSFNSIKPILNHDFLILYSFLSMLSSNSKSVNLCSLISFSEIFFLMLACIFLFCSTCIL